MTEQAAVSNPPSSKSPAQETFSVSKLKCYLRCPAVYYYRYILGLYPPPSSNMMLGTAIHGAIEHNFRKKKETHQDLPVSDVQEFFSANFNYLKGQVLWEPGEVPGKIKDEGVKLLELYLTELAPKIMPDLVEDVFHVKFENCSCIFKGIIDLVTEEALIVDHKTSGRSPIPEAVHKDLQCTAYSLGFRFKTKRIEKGIAFDYLVRGKNPKLVRVETSRSQSDIDGFLRLLGRVMTAVQEGLFYPNSTGQFCTERMCQFWSECAGGRKFNYASPTK